MTLIAIGLGLAALFAAVIRLAIAADRREEQLEREWLERRCELAAEVADVPVDWLDTLDDILRIPETAA